VQEDQDLTNYPAIIEPGRKEAQSSEYTWLQIGIKEKSEPLGPLLHF
jgi:hypothetical protein